MKKFFSKTATTITTALILLIVVTGFFIYEADQNKELSAEQLDKKFDCNRITADFKYTDVFCGNPKFYNNPEGLTYDEYYEYYGCKERLESKPPDLSLKDTDPGFYKAFYDCKDKIKMEQLRQEFIKELKRLKIENS